MEATSHGPCWKTLLAFGIIFCVGVNLLRHPRGRQRSSALSFLRNAAFRPLVISSAALSALFPYCLTYLRPAVRRYPEPVQPYSRPAAMMVNHIYIHVLIYEKSTMRVVLMACLCSEST